MYKKIIILGLGNLLYKDEGIGIHLIRELEKMKLPPNLELIDGGVGSLDILLSLENIDKLIIIDALKGGGAPATVYRIDYQELEAEIDFNNLSLHQLSLLEVLSLIKKLGKLPSKVLIIGVEPKEISPGLNLTSRLKEKLPYILGVILKECHLKEDLS
ncbi:MAG: Ni,Fe-hydrogenase maturation factor [Candidatus Omnitrophota bacterium]|nr:MAG: Ni,Fe-hydrogenase maturation factor [Candidatus Omnitrophota bacterium]